MKAYTVVIIDDDVWMQRILSKTLQSYGFKNVILCTNGFEGLDSVIENKPDLIILDIMMPELSGHLTLKIIKNIKLTKHIPVLIVSALSDTENLGLAVKSGTAGFISKPFTRATVYEKLVQIFGKEKLDLMIRGEAISDETELINNNSPMESIQTSGGLDNSLELDMVEFKADLFDDNDDIDSIKKFLNKNKK